jgi:hypothetical protein
LRSFARVKTRITTHEGAQQFSQFPANPISPTSGHCIRPAPDTRTKLLEAMDAEGFGHDQLAEMQRIIDADNSDLFDVLAHVAYALPTVTREERAAGAKVSFILSSTRSSRPSWTSCWLIP